MPYFFYMLKRINKTDGFGFLFSSIFYILFSTLHTLSSVLLPAYITASIFDSTAMKKTLIIFVLMILSEQLKTIAEGISSRICFRYRLKEVHALNSACIRLPIYFIDTSEGKTIIENAQGAVSYGNAQGVESFLISYRDGIANFFVLIAYGVLLYEFNIVVLILFIVLSSTHIFICKYIDRSAQKEQEKWLQSFEKQSVLKRAIVSPVHEKDIRLNFLNLFLLKKLQTLQSESFKYISSREKRYVLQAFFLCLISFTRNFLLLFYSVTFSGISIEKIVLYIGIILNIDASISAFWYEVKNIKEQRIHIASLKTFYDLDLQGGDSEVHEPKTIAKINIENVSFKYDDTEIIKKLSCSIRGGEKLAIVGPNGAGKTTLIKLLCGFYKPLSGTISYYDNKNNVLNETEIRQTISAAFQENILFAFSVFENIALKEADTTSEQYRTLYDKTKTIIEMVGLDKKIPSPEAAVGTYLSDNGVLFSGGEEQRLLLARALFKNASLILLDEPDSALDNTAQTQVYELLNGLLKNQTAIFVSHRLGSIKFCDRILFFKTDKEIIIGTHQDLYANEPEYKNMYDTETSFLKKLTF